MILTLLLSFSTLPLTLHPLPFLPNLDQETEDPLGDRMEHQLDTKYARIN
jgi:hypothetical protein